MTTLVALACKDALVMGTDSLGTFAKRLIDPVDLLRYFDANDDYKLKLDDQGNPMLDNLRTLFEQAQDVPYNQQSNLTKLFDLSPLPMGVMFTGIASIGNQTIRKHITKFKEDDPLFNVGSEPSNYSVQSAGSALLKHLRHAYVCAFPDPDERPELELIIGGYDHLSDLPSLFRLDVREDTITRLFSSDSPFGAAFGGQYDWIQRIVFGTDSENEHRLALRVHDLLDEYEQRVSDAVSNAGLEFEVPKPDFWGDEFRLFNDWGLQGLDANFDDFSEQNAIDCVDFFIELMARSQTFSSQLPTVGGDIHVAVIRKDGFRFVSRQEWRHGDHTIKITED